MKILKGDNVMVIAGKDKGKTGKVIKAFPKLDKVTVIGVNLVKKHQKPTKNSKKGQIIEKEAPFQVSNVMIIDPKLNKPSRVSFKIEDGKKIRISQKSGTVLK